VSGANEAEPAISGAISIASGASGKFKFGAKVIEPGRFATDDGGAIYQFDPILADIPTTPSSTSEDVDVSEIDTIVLPPRSSKLTNEAPGSIRFG